jgi:hypothetical protein
MPARVPVKPLPGTGLSPAMVMLTKRPWTGPGFWKKSTNTSNTSLHSMARRSGDSTPFSSDRSSDNMLSVDSRLGSAVNWRLVALHDGRSALCYTSVLSECLQIPTASGHIFPFPPEAVAHVADFHKYMALAHKHFAECVKKNYVVHEGGCRRLKQRNVYVEDFC